MYKPLADSTLMNMSKREIIEHLRIAEHNHRVCEETIDQQYKNCMKLLKDEKVKTIDEFATRMKEALSHDWATTPIFEMQIYNRLFDVCNEIATILKEVE